MTRNEEICDYCFRPFARVASEPAICPSCGLENVPESAMLAPAPEKAVLASPAPRRRVPRKKK